MTDVRRFGGLSCAEADDLAPAAALDALDAREEAALQAHLAACPEPHPMFATFALTAASLAELADPVDPPSSVKTRLLAAVAEDLAGRDAAAAKTAPAVRATRADIVAAPSPVDLGTERARRRPALGWVLAAAAVIAIVALAGTSLFLQSRLDTAQQLAVQLRDAIAAAGQPGAQVATVSGTDAQPGAGGFVVLPAEGSGYLVVDDLAPLAAGQVYEAWTIVGDAAPVSAGLATPTDGLAIFPLPTGAPIQVVALTIEPPGGSQTPTMPIQAAGTFGS
ncbi:MAG TPA: anti-sigma factor [Candidatus Saccharimonadia bacterium]|nr:anti-sigma factor [Candidatus Saccharimonadia bacterium]